MDATSRNPFMRTAWLGSWYATYLPNAWRTHVVIVRQGGSIHAVAPLIAGRAGPVRIFRFAGHGLGNYLDIVVGDGGHALGVSALLEHIGDMRPAVLDWHDLNSASPSSKLMPGRVAHLYANPQATFAREWAEHFRTTVREGKVRRRFTRNRERLELRGAVSFVPEVSTADPSLLAELHDLHRRRFVGTPNALLETRFWEFFRLLADRTLGKDLIISLLRLDGRLISFLAGLRADRTFISYFLAFEPSLARDSPGHVHLMQFQEHLIATGWRALDFSKGEDQYKRRWSNDRTSNWDHVVGFGALGRATAAAVAIRSRLRAWARAKGLTRHARRMLTHRKRVSTRI